ncbi:hypothetical protein [Devosia sp. FKR38]|uniref:hypothetical protein n=1 Tax=Devosia sp. FKR38 TaxID=2562312 RepID=UPI0010BF98F3|nr:hypothetical protein [Devosia sp. FKR38]
MFAHLSSFFRSRKILPRMILGAIGAVAALAIIKVVETRAEELPPGGVDAALHSLSPDLFGVLSQSFAPEYEVFKTAVARDIQIGGDLRTTTTRTLMALRTQYSPHIAQADDASLAALATNMMDYYQAINDIEGPDVCARYVTEGPVAFAGTDIETRHSQGAMTHLATMLQTARNGLDHPVTRRAATDAEWQAVASKSLTLGATAEGFSAMAQGIADPGVCPSLVAFLEATQGDEAAALVRAEILTLLATGE